MDEQDKTEQAPVARLVREPVRLSDRDKLSDHQREHMAQVIRDALAPLVARLGALCERMEAAAVAPTPDEPAPSAAKDE